jgi:hypothetical protein
MRGKYVSHLSAALTDKSFNRFSREEVHNIGIGFPLLDVKPFPMDAVVYCTAGLFPSMVRLIYTEDGSILTVRSA